MNLHQIARDVVASSRTPDRDAITEAVFAAIPAEDRDEALRVALRVYVGTVIGADRRERLTGAHEGRTSVQAPRQGRSWKRDAMRKHRAELRAIIHTPSGGKYLADCTYDDLAHAAAYHASLAAGNNAAARRLHQWMAQLTEHNVTTVGDLPATTVERVLLVAAA